MKVLKDIQTRMRIPMEKLRPFFLENQVVQTPEVREINEHYSDGKDGLWGEPEIIYELARVYCENSNLIEETTTEILEGTMQALSLMVEMDICIEWFSENADYQEAGDADIRLLDLYLGWLGSPPRMMIIQGEKILTRDYGNEDNANFDYHKVKSYVEEDGYCTVFVK